MKNGFVQNTPCTTLPLPYAILFHALSYCASPRLPPITAAFYGHHPHKHTKHNTQPPRNDTMTKPGLTRDKRIINEDSQLQPRALPYRYYELHLSLIHI